MAVFLNDLFGALVLSFTKLHSEALQLGNSSIPSTLTIFQDAVRIVFPEEMGNLAIDRAARHISAISSPFSTLWMDSLAVGANYGAILVDYWFLKIKYTNILYINII